MSTDTAAALPTKKFFVDMLTKDISLDDAILDLVDNCLDGALRSSNGDTPDYGEYKVEIEFDADHFLIRDNCGGISRDIAKNYAFKMGRDTGDDRDNDRETVGMYGVGMKRAIFKMGRDTVVKTRYDEDCFEVPISSAWLELIEWKPLPINDVTGDQRLTYAGTEIRVDTLNEGVSRHFSNEFFEKKLCEAIAEHFTMFLQSGLKVNVNGKAIIPVKVEVLVSRNESAPSPYVYRNVINGVEVLITVGMNTSNWNPSADEFTEDAPPITSGWTILCNDRAVIVGDISRMTGWGDGMPIYHPQFSILTGIIEFKSNEAENLPITTTKRGLDTSSDVWLQTYPEMKKAMRVWLTYTNHWKNHAKEVRSEHWKDAKPQPVRVAVEQVLLRTGQGRETKKGAEIYNPLKAKVIPIPKDKILSGRRISFIKPKEEIKELSEALFGNDAESPARVGQVCFEQVLTNVRGDEGQ